MRRSLVALLPLTFCLAACETTRVQVPLRVPADRLDCQAAPDRPAIPPEYRIDWTKVTTVQQAQSEHDAYVRSIRTREGIVAGYLVDIEGQLFVCANDDQWIREWQEGLD